jgi:hypothetical protein
MPVKIATNVTGVSIILAFFDVISWGTVGWVVLGCVVYLVLMAISRHLEEKSD